MEGKLELISRYDEYYLVKSISNEDISLDDILLHNESGRIISVNRFWESNGSKTIMDTGLRNPIELVISGNTFKKLIGYYSEYQKLPLSKLSHKNCQAIANGYDLDELVYEEFQQFDQEARIVYRRQLQESLAAMFNKALEILGDKKFSEEHLKVAADWYYETKGKKSIDEYIQSLQPKEWDVEIELECCSNYSSCNWNCEHGPKPKLDADGCLILKRK